MFGVLAVDKPPKLTSRDVVTRVAKLVKPHRVGHTGTLDPLATGVLLLAVGHAARLVEFSHLLTKHYEADFWLGKSSDTLDADGNLIELESPPQLEREQVIGRLENFRGDIQQTPPRFSAVHVAGKRAYDLARKGKEFDVPPRNVHISELELLHFTSESFGLRVACSTGTYIRSLGSDIARSLGSDAVMFQLTRTRIGDISLEQCVSLESLQSADDVLTHLLPPLSLLGALPRVVLDEAQASQIRNGIPLKLDLDRNITRPWLAVDREQQVVAILTPSGDRYRSLRVFHNNSETSQPMSSSNPHSPES